MKNLKNKVAIITGAASGIGRSVSLELSKMGMKTVITDINEKNLQIVQKEIGENCLAIQADVSNKSDWQNVFDKTMERFNDAHLIVNNAGIAILGDALTISDEDYKRVMDIDFWGVFYGSRIFGEYFKEKQEGHIVNISSAAGLAGAPYFAPYSAAKFAVTGFSETLRAELSDFNIGVSIVCPGVVDTGIIDAVKVQHKQEEKEHNAAKDLIRKMAGSTDTLAKKIINGIKNNEMYILYTWEGYFTKFAQSLPDFAKDFSMNFLAKQMRNKLKL